ncbi:hypothetical protein QUB27_26945, partial [Microcoleus sp. AT8-B6]|uniref:hypothetical protein n=1 Tax=Microcoleus sp. AT8-B6 TaxID=2818622 RepID=UPI002FD131CB
NGNSPQIDVDMGATGALPGSDFTWLHNYGNHRRDRHYRFARRCFDWLRTEQGAFNRRANKVDKREPVIVERSHPSQGLHTILLDHF